MALQLFPSASCSSTHYRRKTRCWRSFSHQIKSSTRHWVGFEKLAVGKQPPILEIKFYWLLSFHWSLNGQLLPNNGTHFFSLPRLNYFRLRFYCIWVPFFAHLNCVRLPRRAKQWEVESDRRLRLTPSNAANDFSSSSSSSASRSSLSRWKKNQHRHFGNSSNLATLFVVCSNCQLEMSTFENCAFAGKFAKAGGGSCGNWGERCHADRMGNQGGGNLSRVPTNLGRWAPTNQWICSSRRWCGRKGVRWSQNGRANHIVSKLILMRHQTAIN